MLCGLTFVFIPSCKKENLCDCFKSTGEINLIEHVVAPFDSIFMEDNVEVQYEEGPKYEVKIEAGRNLQNLVKVEVNNGQLKITNNNKCNFVRSYKKKIIAYVKSPRLRSIYLYGAKNFIAKNTITTDTIDYYLKGSGDMYLTVNNIKVTGHIHGNADINITGTTTEHAVHATGQSFINCQNLLTSYTWIFYNCSGEGHINASGSIVALLYGAGNVYYKGTPSSLQVTRLGKGIIVKE